MSPVQVLCFLSLEVWSILQTATPQPLAGAAPWSLAPLKITWAKQQNNKIHNTDSCGNSWLHVWLWKSWQIRGNCARLWEVFFCHVVGLCACPKVGKLVRLEKQFGNMSFGKCHLTAAYSNSTIFKSNILKHDWRFPKSSIHRFIKSWASWTSSADAWRPPQPSQHPLRRQSRAHGTASTWGSDSTGRESLRQQIAQAWCTEGQQRRIHSMHLYKIIRWRTSFSEVWMMYLYLMRKKCPLICLAIWYNMGIIVYLA